ncbi:MAG: hypothetical protein VX777_10635 [Chlamydiota bacterium]|nr:hypothetical protein [Chlamydiota bacterium]
MNEEKKISAEEAIRKLNELALEAGKSRLNPQTGYLHHCYHPGETELHVTIPIYENMLYAYSLLKSKTAENVNEAKALISGLLCFQSQEGEFSKGNFPIYIHEFPQCKDRLLGIRLLPVMLWIYKQFSHVLGEDLCSKLRNSSISLFNFCKKTSEEKTVPLPYQLTVECAVNAYAATFELDIKNTETSTASFTRDCLDTHSQGQILTALQMQYEKVSESPWKFIWDFLENSYDPNTAAYVGPAAQLYQDRLQPEVTTMDLHYAAITGVFPDRLNDNSIVMLRACMIQPHNDSLKLTHSQEDRGVSDGLLWHYLKGDGCSMSAINSSLDRELSDWKGLLPFRMVWGDENHVSTLVAQGGNYQTLSADLHENEASLVYVLSEEVDVENREQCREVILSFDRNETVEIDVNGIRATTFQVGDEINVKSKNIKTSILFSVIEGDGDFFGHIMPGNRVSQLALKNGNRFNAYDWQLFLRTLRRSKNCKIGVRIKIKVT